MSDSGNVSESTTKSAAPAAPAQRRSRIKKRPHTLHRCANAEDLNVALHALDIDAVALVSEFVKPSFPVGVLAVGSLTWGVATEYSDLDLLVLVPSPDAFKPKRKQVASGSPVKYQPSDAANTSEVSLFVSGVEIDVYFVTNPAIDRHVEPLAARDRSSRTVEDYASPKVLNRLATGWIVAGRPVVERWRHYYGTDRLPTQWMATEFIDAAKELEDMEAGIGLAKGHVPLIGACAVTGLMRALLAYSGGYCPSLKWMLKVDMLINTAPADIREALVAGRELAFPPLLRTEEEERAYFERVCDYCGTVRAILSRDEALAALLDSYTHDLDIIA